MSNENNLIDKFASVGDCDWVEHSNTKAHKSKKCITCFVSSCRKEK